MSIFDRIFGRKKYVRYNMNEEAVFDYSKQPENFIVRMKSGVDYTVKRGEDVFHFSVFFKPDKLSPGHGSCRMIWNRIERHTRVLRPKKLVPYLVHCDGSDYLYIYEHRADNVTSSSIGFTELNDGEHVSYSDYTQKGFLSEPTDPKNVIIAKRINILGSVYCAVAYHVSEHGSLAENEEKKYYYCDEKFTRQKFIVEKDCRVTAFDNTESVDTKEITLQKGSVFTRLRTDDECMTDLLLEDGRVFRITERYLFSEPQPFMMLSCADDETFEYSEVK